MPSIRIWTVESDNDDKAIQIIAEKCMSYSKTRNMKIQSAGKRAYTSSVAKRRGKEKIDRLKAALRSYLKQDSKVIFVLDSDSKHSLNERRNEKRSHVSLIENILESEEFKGKVYLIFAVHELEAWLLIDCIGIFCYFASTPTNRYPKGDCRVKAPCDRKIKRFINKYQKGDTQTIEEAEPGGFGPKEYLVEYSKKILQHLNPNMSDKAMNAGKYQESLSPDIPKYVEIKDETINRNASLKKFNHLLKRCENS